MTLRHIATVAAGAAFVALVPLSAAAQTIQVNRDNRTISVTAMDKVTVMADTATVHVGFVVYGPDSDATYAAGSRLSNSIMNAITSFGIAKDDIQSENQSLQPVPDFQNQKLTPEEKAQHKFQLTQSWTVRTAADNASKVLDTAVKAGANQSGQIDWSLKDENSADAQAAAKALEHARAQAETMAKALNAKLGNVLYVSNQVESMPLRPVARMAMAPMAMNKVEPLAINPREIERSATVSAVFAIE